MGVMDVDFFVGKTIQTSRVCEGINNTLRLVEVSREVEVGIQV